MEDKVVVFTRKEGPSAFYQSFVAGDIKLDIRRLKPSDVVSIALSPEKQDQQNVRKLKGLSPAAWEELVNEIDLHGNLTDLATVKRILHLDDGSEAEAVAARSNMTTIVRLLHSRSSQMMDMLLAALRQGKLCIVDVSQMRGAAALILSGLILQRIFDTNQEEFTKAQPNTIPTIAVIEEAQSVLGGSGTSSGEGPYVSWVKEGRKYDLGAVMVTQQPGSITTEILSQGDNWFIFHLLSAVDLQTLRKANAHFSEDILSALLNEPIPGHGVFWSSVAGKPYPVALRVLSFEDGCQLRDPGYDKPPAHTFAALLRQQFQAQLAAAAAAGPAPGAAAVGTAGQEEGGIPGSADDENEPPQPPIDALEAYRRQAIEKLRLDEHFRQQMAADGMAWGFVVGAIEKHLPNTEDKNKVAFQLVKRALDDVFGPEQWETTKKPTKSKPQGVTWVRLKK